MSINDQLSREAIKENNCVFIRSIFKCLSLKTRYKTAADCLNDPMGKQLVDNALDEISEAQSIKYGIQKEAVQELNGEIIKNAEFKEEPIHYDLLNAIHTNHALVDSAVLCKDNGVFPYYISKIIAYGFFYEDDTDKSSLRITEYAQYYGLRDAIEKYCRIDNEPEIRQLIAEQYQKMNQEMVEDEKRIALKKNAFARGFENEKKYKGCAQCTLLTMFQTQGRKNDLLFQSVSGMAAGMALSGDGACGGYSGGILYMGSIIGRRIDRLEDGDKEAKTTSYIMAQKLRDKFIQTYGSVICSGIHQKIFGESFCLRTSEMKNAFEEAGAHTKKCTAVIGMASVWLTEILCDMGFVEQGGINDER